MVARPLIRWFLFVQDFLHSGFRHGQVILVLFQPLVIVLLDFWSPSGIDLSSGVLLSEALVTEHVLKMSAFRVFDNLLSQLGRDEDHAAVPPEDHISLRNQDLPNAGRPDDAHHVRVKQPCAGERSKVVGGIAVANKGGEVEQFVETVDIAPGQAVFHTRANGTEA